MRVLVVGGRGHIGGQVMRAARAAPELEVRAAGRRPAAGVLALDLRAPQGFRALDDFDAVVNCTDTFRLPPQAMASACLARGKLYLETSADTDSALALLELPVPPEATGTVLLGAGIFPGVSNLLAAEVVRDAAGCDGFELAYSWSVLSEAGAGTCEVMVQSLGRPRRYYASGELVAGAPLGKPVPTPAFARARRGLPLGFPEAVVVARSLGLRDSLTVAATRPMPPLFVARLAGALAARGVFANRVARACLRAGFLTMRRLFLAGRTTDLEMAAVATRSGSPVSVAKLACADAFATAGQAIIAKLCFLARHRERRRPGVHGIEQALSLTELLAELQRLGFSDLRRADNAGGAARRRMPV